jgi:serine phosphatase RsbU (regulator of sigma subunit)
MPLMLFGQFKDTPPGAYQLSESAANLNTQWSFVAERFDTTYASTNDRRKIVRFGRLPQGVRWGTFHLRVILPKHQAEAYALSLPYLQGGYRLYVNGKLLHSSGHAATDMATEVPTFSIPQMLLLPRADTLDFCLQYSNHHYYFSGSRRPVWVGEYQVVGKNRRARQLVEMFFLTTVLVMGIYHLILYSQRRIERQALHYGLLCLSIGIQLSLLGESLLLEFVPLLSWEAAHSLRVISFSLAFYLGLLYLHELFAFEAKLWMAKVVLVAVVLMIAASILLPTRHSSLLFLYFQWFLLGGFVYVFWLSGRAWYFKRPYAGLTTLGLGVLISAYVIDFITVVYAPYYVSVWIFWTALLVFFFIQSFVLARRFSDAFQIIDEISRELRLRNQTLEETVRQRTAEINEAYDKLQYANQELTLVAQKVQEKNLIVEEQNVHIVDSIKYAKRIQNAILPRLEDIQAHLPNSFVFFQPRDIVSGDFYWFAQKKYKVVLAAVDCTGHGIPGAFMSLIGNDILHELVNIRNITEPDKILNELRTSVQRVLSQEHTGNQDGMDIAICTIDTYPVEYYSLLGLPKIQYAGASHPLVYIQNNELHHIKGDPIIIGGFNNYVQKDSFDLHTIQLSEPTSFYIFSDGFQDQFGQVGSRSKKFGSRRLRELLLEIHQYDFDEQAKILEKTLREWQGDIKQTDDVLIIGFKAGKKISLEESARIVDFEQTLNLEQDNA